MGHLREHLLGPATFLLAILIGLLLKRLLYRRLQSWASRTETRLDDILLTAMDRPLTLLIVGAGLVILSRRYDLDPGVDGMVLTAFQGLLILASVLFADRFLSGMVDEYAARQPALSASRGIVKGVARAVIYGLGALVLLGTLGIAITPVLASLGVGSLAVALALQEPLSNLFSGLSLLIDKPIHPGHYIQLEGLGVEGFVEEVGWRATKIRTLQNNLVLVPNARLVGSVITNFDRPEKDMLVPVPVSVAYGSDLARVEAVTLEVMRQVMEAHGLAEQAARADVVYTAFGDSGICFDARLIATGFAMRPVLKGAFIQALHARYRAEGIEIPYPTRTILTGTTGRN